LCFYLFVYFVIGPSPRAYKRELASVFARFLVVVRSGCVNSLNFVWYFFGKSLAFRGKRIIVAIKSYSCK